MVDEKKNKKNKFAYLLFSNCKFFFCFAFCLFFFCMFLFQLLLLFLILIQFFPFFLQFFSTTKTKILSTNINEKKKMKKEMNCEIKNLINAVIYKFESLFNSLEYGRLIMQKKKVYLDFYRRVKISKKNFA